MAVVADVEGPENERRHYRRVPLATPVIVVSSGEVQSYRPRDIGAGGLFLYGRNVPPLGSRVQVEFVAGKNRYSIAGLVIRQDTAGSRPGFAVAFDLSEPERARLEQVLVFGNDPRR